VVPAVLTISSGHSAEYLTGAVATGRENYYTGAVAAGEPTGRWYGRGAQALGLSGLVDHQDMTALYEHFLDPRDRDFGNPARWRGASTLGQRGRRYRSEEEIYAAALEAEPHASPERRTELRLEAGKQARKNVAFLDATFSVQKSVTVLHTAFEAQEVAARRTAEQAQAGEAAARASADVGAQAQHAYRYAEARTAEQSWAAHRTAVESAIWAGNHAALDYLADKAGYSRVGHHGGAAGRYTDAHDWIIGSFFQHDSRDHDPQLHIHNAILNRVQCSDGQWRTLDSRAIHKYRGAAAAVGERTMEEHLTRSLGVRFATRPDGKAREILGVPQQVMALFSSRRRAITTKTAALARAFEAKFNRHPNSLELDRLQRQATFATRLAKSTGGESTEQRLQRWDAELRAEIAGGLAQVAETVLAARRSTVDSAASAPHRLPAPPQQHLRPDRDPVDSTAPAPHRRPAPPQQHLRPDRDPVDGAAPGRCEWSVRAVIETALAQVQSRKAAWTEGDLTRAISDALPDHLGELDGPQIAALLNGLTTQALTLAVPLDPERPAADTLPAELRLTDGRSAYDAPGGRLYATPDHVHSEHLLSASAARTGAPALDPAAAAAFLTSLAEAGIELGADQAAAARGILTSAARLETLIGPAGTGKSFVVGALARAWQDPALWQGVPHRAVGLATSQIATEVLAGEGITARNIARWLAAQQRISAGNARPEDLPCRLGAGDLVILDEASMVTTADLAAIHQHVTRAGAKLLLTGDHRQLAAVGAGGALDLLTGTAPTHELTEARRFRAGWEGPASLRLREGDQRVLADYHKHGRLLDGGALEQAEASAARAWLADTLRGRRSLLIVGTNEQAARLSAQIRSDLVRLNLVAEAGVPLALQGTWAGVGDIVQARRNAWDLAAIGGNRRGPINRELYRVRQVYPDGSLLVTPHHGDPATPAERLTLPADYVSRHLALGYAATVHSAEGLTVDTAHTVVTTATGPEALYVGMSRGRLANTAHVVTRAVPPDNPTGTVNHAAHRSPAAVLAGTLEATDPQRSALAVATELAAATRSIRTPAELLADAAELATAGRTARWLDRLTADGHLSPDHRTALAAEDGAATLSRLLRRAELAGHDPHRVLLDAITSRPLDGARQLSNVLHHRITQAVNLDPVADTYTDWIPHLDDPDWHAYLAALARAADTRRAELGRDTLAEPPQWAAESLGPVPTDPTERDEWQERAGAVAAHRELTGHTDPATPLGAPPKPGRAEEYASWRAAWRALGRPEADRDELEMSDGQLRVRIRGYERELAWAPRYVANELSGTAQAAAQHHRTATLRAAAADAATNPEHRAQLDREAADAAALAGILDVRAAELEQADQARATWYAHTAETRATADRARAELAARGAARREEELTTAEEWLAAQAEAQHAEDQHRQITDESDLTDITTERATDEHLTHPAPHADAAETAAPDIRDVAAAEPPQTGEDTVRVPTAAETADTITRAQRALAEIEQRRIQDERAAAEQARADQLNRWHTDDQHTEHATELTDTTPTLELSTVDIP
jgi:hypothetical protein